MKVIIDIPKEFESDTKDNFQDFFERVKVEIEHRVNTDDTLLCGNYERETVEMLLDAFKNMNVIPKVITNGDMIKMLFPDVEVDEKSEDTVHLKDKWRNPLVFIQIPKDIWNAPYRKVEE